MANYKEQSATSALNEDKYINKLYDTNLDTQKKLLQQNYTDNSGVLGTQTQKVQKQTDDNLQRTYVEAAKAQQGYTGPKAPKVNGGVAAQTGLAQWNQQAADTSALKAKQNEADQEIARQRQLLSEQYAAAIRQAQADNDMERAQQLYDAAKAEESQLLEFQKAGASLLAGKNDKSLLEAMANGETPQRDTTSESWEEVFKNEDALNKVYDASLESQRAALEADYLKSMSDLEAKQRQQQEQTDQKLTDTYVDAMQKAKNYAETQGAYGMGSGSFRQARLARDMQTQQELTDLRGVQMAADAKSGMEGFGIGKNYRDAIAKAQQETDQKRAKALYEAAEKEEQTLVDTQKFLGEEYAKKHDYTILGKLYGLTDEQIRKLGTGGGGGGGGGGRSGGSRKTSDSYLSAVSESNKIRNNALKRGASKSAANALANYNMGSWYQRHGKYK